MCSVAPPMCLHEQLLAAAASHLLVAPSLRLLAEAEPIQSRTTACHGGRHHSWHANATTTGRVSDVLILHTDSRPPQDEPDAYWSVSAAANAQYAHLHGYDFVYAILPESTHFRRPDGRPQARLRSVASPSSARTQPRTHARARAHTHSTISCACKHRPRAGCPRGAASSWSPRRCT